MSTPGKGQLSLAQVGVGYLGPAIHKIEDVTVLSKKILDMYDKDRTGHLGHTEVANILMDMYRSINKNINPSKFDIESFCNVMDMNKDGKVTQPDIEACIRKFLKAEVEPLKIPSSGNSITTTTTRTSTVITTNK